MLRKKILIIDDEKGFTAMLSLNLEAMGNYEVRIENDSMSALSSALQFQPDLILLDIIMPYKEGPEVALEMKNNERLRNIPIIFLTATVTHTFAGSRENRIDDHPVVAKPSDLEVLFSYIEKNLTSVC